MSKLAFSETIVLLLLGSVPFDFRKLSAIWCTVLIMTFLTVLLLWGPGVVSGRWRRFALWLSVSIFFTSLLDQNGYQGGAIWASLLLALPLGLWLSLLRSIPRTQRSAGFRRIALAAAACFLASVAWVLHTRLHDARGGSHWGVDFLVVGRLVELLGPYRYLVSSWAGHSNMYPSRP